MANIIYQGDSGLFKLEKAFAKAREILGTEKKLESNPDCLLIEPTDGKIPVAEVNRLIEFTSISSLGGKVVVIDRAHLGTMEFQQAILKQLEDLSDRCVFLLTTEERLIETIHSRCTTIYVRKWSEEAMVEYAKQHNEVLSETELFLADGRPGVYEKLRGSETLARAEQLQKDLTCDPSRALNRLGALDEDYYTSHKEEYSLFLGFMEKVLISGLIDNQAIAIETRLDLIELICSEKKEIRKRGYGKTEAFRFLRTAHNLLCR